MRLLERIVPGIYADPDRARKCRNCGQAVPRGTGRFCSDRCSFEYWVDVTA